MATEGRLSEVDGALLVQIARRGLEDYVRYQEVYQPDPTELPPALQEPGASFITLTAFGELRGCIGVTSSYRPLAIDVAQNAISAATRDPRFPPVRSAELPVMRLSVTVLTPARQLEYTDYDSLLNKLRPQIDGVTLEWRQQRAVLLPQVWRRIPQPEQFLFNLCLKGHIPTDELLRTPPTVLVHTFQVQHFYESGYLEPGGMEPEH